MIENLQEDKIFEKENFTDKIMCNSEYVSCQFISCNFSNSDLSDSEFMDCIFDSCNLSLAKVLNTKIKNIQFIKCKITGIDFSVCNDFLFSCRFKECIIGYCTFWSRKLKKTIFKDCSLKDSDFSEADLTGTQFNNCDLLNSIFRNTILEKVDFRSSFNYSINPELNNIKKAKFSIQGLPGLLSKYDIIIE
ncbi:MAG: pentapeptide repeat-containing protein [Chitinophagaceae bacterium]